jgi:exosortase B
MSDLRASSHNESPARFAWPWSALLIGSFLVAYTPTFLSLIHGPWKTEQEGHGPLIIAASLWLAWQSSDRLRAVALSPAPVAGWTALLIGLLLMILARTQGVLGAEVLSTIIVIAGCALLLAGRPMLRTLAFPVGFLLFAVPLPDWMIDAATVPLKVFISDRVTSILYAAGYPIAQNGVIIVIGSYELLVKDACSGMNSIFALSAIGVFYAHAFRWHSKIRSLILMAAIVPIAIAANFIRVLALVLIAYYGGIDRLAGPLHVLTGIGLFVVAVILLVTFDGLLGIGTAVFGLSRPRVRVASIKVLPHADSGRGISDD